jgi:DNA-directed RNA polymerase subunit RPC12/RpoP
MGRIKNLVNFIYDNGFSKRYYICDHCHSKKLLQIPQGGFSPPRYLCQSCGKEVLSPIWEDIVEPTIEEDIPSAPWITRSDLNLLVHIKPFQHC